jgi:transposase
MTDLDGARVLDVIEDRTREAADTLWKTLPAEQREQVRGVAMDMWDPYIASTREHAPTAEIVHDKFHVSKHLNEAVDQVRRQENKSLKAEDDDRLVGSKQLWLYNPKNLSRKRKKALDALKDQTLKTSRAWAIKEYFRKFWNYTYTDSAARFFEDWYGWAIRSRLKPVRAKAKMLKNHLGQLLSYFRQPITNAMSEGFNSRIQAIKSAARGFRAFANYRTRILFYCGKLDLFPDGISH